MTSLRPAFAASLLLALAVVSSQTAEAAAPLPLERPSATNLVQLAQAQPAPDAAPPTPATDATPAASAAEPIGNVVAITGTLTVIRNKNSQPLKLRDDIYLNDIVQTSTAASLGITFDDGTTFRLSANAKITIDSYVYEDGGKQNSAIFNIARGTVGFVAAAVAKTGDMKIDTPTVTLGIRGTTGVIEVPDDATAAGTAAATRNVAVKLYPDADGRVGHIEVNDRQGVRLGALTQGASGFAIRPGVAGGAARFAAVPLVIAARDVQRDRGFVRELHTSQTLGRRIVTEQRAVRRANPGLAPNRGSPLRPNGAPAQPQAPRNPQPSPPTGRQGLQQPGARPRPGSPLPANRPAQPPQRPERQGQQQQAPSPQPNLARPAETPRLTPNAPQLRPGDQREAAPRLQRPGLPLRPVPPRGRQAPRGNGKQQPQLR
ncbi:FecR domain-containing protein [Bradyrhizobium ontarionense]|uniref:FecR domain-containing protein n=1 Tax=Bradyrhizobium ontarionense TaxID=2898149 RepID=A0ABY3RA53_9BRAD|nr:FecR family protein [Bradyrhizobium sp. A19]UFZ03912.1 FecR domain-containing protein [Bradyrhizobium sp. A19]